MHHSYRRRRRLLFPPTIFLKSGPVKLKPVPPIIGPAKAPIGKKPPVCRRSRLLPILQTPLVSMFPIIP